MELLVRQKLLKNKNYSQGSIKYFEILNIQQNGSILMLLQE